MDFKILDCDRKDAQLISSELVSFNAKHVPFTQNEPFQNLGFKIEVEGELVAGILGCLYCWNCLEISVLWVEERYRGRGLGKRLLQKIESVAKEKMCYLIHLDTFDFQAKDFYLSEGYEVFGELENCPPHHNRFYLKKEL